jgi:hypothetical protein
MSGDELRGITYALLRPETALAAVRALHACSERRAAEGLVELLLEPRTAREAVAAIRALEATEDVIVVDALHAALASDHASVRQAASQDLQRRRLRGRSASLSQVLCRDESWPVRRTALQIIASEPGPERWRVLDAVTDPHWRIRHALIRVLVHWSDNEASRQEIDRRLRERGPAAQVQGLRAYLHFCWTGITSEPAMPLDKIEVSQNCQFWDWDAAVLLRNLEHMSATERRDALDFMPFLLTHADERIRAVAAKALRDGGECHHLVRVVALLDELRHEGAGGVVKLLSELDQDRREELARLLLHSNESTPAQLAWALDQVGEAFPADEESARLTGLVQKMADQSLPVRCALARLAGRWNHPAADDWLEAWLADAESAAQCEALRSLNRRFRRSQDLGILRQLLASDDADLRTEAVTATIRRGCGSDVLEPLAGDPEVQVRVRLARELVGRVDSWAIDLVTRLQADVHPHVRAAALTAERAAELIGDPGRETSWHVLATAARLARVPLWKLEPASPWRPPASPHARAEALEPRAATPPQTRYLGPEQLAVAPLGISGHYGLSVPGFVRAYEAGVNLMFWEPNYRSMTEFFSRLGPADRGSIHLLAGTFEADGPQIERDAARMLRALQVERIAVFLLFWVQSWQRVTSDVRAALERLKAAGKIAAYGLSTHSRSLAVEAIDAGWDPVMIRHSAAHRGAEVQVFPRAVEFGTSLITFSNTCYGRLLEPHDGMAPPSASDCYRYAMMQSGVRACLSAPASLAQLEENLKALHDPALPEERRAYLQAFGDRLYKEETMFRKCVRDL